MTPENLESNLEGAAKKGIIDLVAILGTSLTLKGKKARMLRIAEDLKVATSEVE